MDTTPNRSPVLTPRGSPSPSRRFAVLTPRGSSSPSRRTRRQRRNAVPFIDTRDPTIQGLTELDGLFGGAGGAYVSNIGLADKVVPVLTDIEKSVRCVSDAFAGQ